MHPFSRAAFIHTWVAIKWMVLFTILKRTIHLVRHPISMSHYGMLAPDQNQIPSGMLCFSVATEGGLPGSTRDKAEPPGDGMTDHNLSAHSQSRAVGGYRGVSLGGDDQGRIQNANRFRSTRVFWGNTLSSLLSICRGLRDEILSLLAKRAISVWVTSITCSEQISQKVQIQNPTHASLLRLVHQNDRFTPI